VSRLPCAWSPALSAAIVMCILVTRAPTSKMTKSSLEELDAVADLFQEAAPSCRFANNILDSILNLRRKAHEAVSETQNSLDTNTFSPAELDRLGGKTHLISKLDPSGNITTSTAIDSSPPCASHNPAGPCEITEHMHPTIAQDMRSFDLSENTYFDFPADAFTGAEQPQSMTGIQYTESMFNAPQPMGSYNFQAGYHSPSMGFNTAPPMLDATWQSFVEQLGF